MLELISFGCAAVLIVWMPMQARKVARGWVDPKFHGSPTEWRARFERQLTVCLWLGVTAGVASLIVAMLLPAGTRRIVRLAGMGLWLGVAFASLKARSVLDDPRQ